MFVNGNGVLLKMTITNHMVAAGTIIDFLGVKISLIIGFGILLISRCVLPRYCHFVTIMVYIKHTCRFAIVFVTSKFWVCLILVTTLPLGQAMGIPVLQVNKNLLLVILPGLLLDNLSSRP